MKPGRHPLPLALVLLIAFALPPLLAVPVVLVLQRQQGAFESAKLDLDRALERAQAQAPELQGVNRTRAQILARKPILEVVEASRPDVVALMNVLGALPPGVRLDRVETAGTSVALYGTGSMDAAATALRSAGLTGITADPPAGSEFEIFADFAALSAPAQEARP